MRTLWPMLVAWLAIALGTTSAAAAQDVTFARSRTSSGATPKAPGESLHLRVGLGVGALHLGGGGGRYDGMSFDFEFGIGKEITTQDVVLFAIRATIAPRGISDSDGALRGFGASGGSLGLTYLRYLRPERAYVGAGLDLLFFSLSQSGDSQASVGPSLRFVVGREWRVAEGVGAGFSLTLAGAYLHETHGSPAAPPTSLGLASASLAFTLVFR